MTTPTLLKLAALLTLTACGGGSGKGDDTGGGAAVGPGACYIETAVEDAAMCYTFSGLVWTESTAEDYCETQVTPGSTMEWRPDENCPSGADGACEVALIPGFDFEVYFYGMGLEAGETACGIMGGDWSD